jgi:cardiolipin synthase
MKLAILSLFTLLLVVGCASPPDVDYDAVRTMDVLDPTGHVAVMRNADVRLAGEPFREGNRVDLLQDGNATFPAMLAAIKKARRMIDMESFTFDDKAGRQFAEALIARHRAGVKVNLLYDAWGSSDTPSGIFDYMRGQGINLLENNPLTAIDVADGAADQRDHRKLLIVDHRIAFVGGVNISAVYLKKRKVARLLPGVDDAAAHLPWRDTHIRIIGPVVADFESLFQRKWIEQNGDPADVPFAPANDVKRGDEAVQEISNSPDREQYALYRTLLTMIDLAQRTVHLTTGYFVPTPGLMEALMRAAARGVDVQLMLPSVSDSDMALHAGHAYYGDLLRAGVHIHEYQDEVLHAKTAVIDGVWSTVGSSNLDWRSAVINDECNAVILSHYFGAHMEQMFRDDEAKAKSITLEAWEDRPFMDRLNEFKASIVDYFL